MMKNGFLKVFKWVLFVFKSEREIFSKTKNTDTMAQFSFTTPEELQEE